MASILGFFSVSPACAGMIPAAKRQPSKKRCEPRMRGDDPYGMGQLAERLT